MGKYTDQELIDLLSENLIWDVVVADVEKVDQLSVMLKDIDYLEDKEKVLSKITRCEIIETESFDVIASSLRDDKINLAFNMDYIMFAWIEDDCVYRVQGEARGKCEMHNIYKYNWEDVDFNRIIPDDTLADMRGLVDVLQLECDNVECDDLSA